MIKKISVDNLTRIVLDYKTIATESLVFIGGWNIYAFLVFRTVFALVTWMRGAQSLKQ
jgi:hypothetical protein